MSLGGHIDPQFGAPIEVDAHVQSLSDGAFINDGPMGKGTKSEMGPTAVLRIGGVEVIVISNRLQNTDLQTFESQGIDPASGACWWSRAFTISAPRTPRSRAR